MTNYIKYLWQCNLSYNPNSRSNVAADMLIDLYIFFDFAAIVSQVGHTMNSQNLPLTVDNIDFYASFYGMCTYFIFQCYMKKKNQRTNSVINLKAAAPKPAPALVFSFFLSLDTF